MKIFKAFLIVIGADILCLFISFTLAASAMPAIRVVSALCTVGILLVMLINLAMNTAGNDLRQERIDGKKTNHIITFASALASSITGIVSWIVLKISVKQGFEFYRWHKIINAPFLQLYNFINPDASSSALTSSQVWKMLPLAFVPALAYLSAYFLLYKGVISLNSK